MDERSLGDVEIVDSTPNTTPQDFDIEDFINGARPLRRSVRLFPRADLIARLDEIATRIEDTPEGENVDDLVDEFERVKAEFRHGQWFTIEKRSSDWQEQFRLDTEKRLGMKRVREDEDSEPALSTRDLATISLHQLAAQIVAPAGTTVQQLERLRDTNEGELSKLIYTMIEANTRLAQASEVLNKDFSRRRSGSQ